MSVISKPYLTPLLLVTATLTCTGVAALTGMEIVFEAASPSAQFRVPVPVV